MKEVWEFSLEFQKRPSAIDRKMYVVLLVIHNHILDAYQKCTLENLEQHFNLKFFSSWQNCFNEKKHKQTILIL